MISGSVRSWNFVLERDHLNTPSPISSDKLIMVHNMSIVQTHVDPSVIEISYVDHDPVNLDVQ